MSIISQYIIMKKMEEKLMELMGKDYYPWANEVAKEAFRKEMEASPNEEFKKMVFDNWDEITR